AASAALETEPLAQRARLPAGDVELGSLLIVEREPEPVGAGAANCRDLGEVDDVAAVNPREAAGRELLLELTKGRGREVRAVEGVDTAVVAVCLDPMDGVVVEQRLRAARADDRDLLDGRGCAPARPREPCHH